MADTVNLTESLKKLEEIAEWFDEQNEVDVEEGLSKVREAAKLIKVSKARLTEIENEFEEIEKEIADGDEVDEEEEAMPTHAQNHATVSDPDEPINLDDIPF